MPKGKTTATAKTTTTSKPAKKETKAALAKKKKEELEELEKMADQEKDWEDVSDDESEDESVNNSEDESLGESDDESDEEEVENESDDDSVEEVTDDDEPQPKRGKASTKDNKSSSVSTAKDNKSSSVSTLKNRVSVTKPKQKSGASYGKQTVQSTQSVSRFNYADYRDSGITLGDADMTDLLRTAIAKAHDAGQQQLKNVLFQTLKATKLECDWPQSYDNRRSFNRRSKYQRKEGSGDFGRVKN